MPICNEICLQDEVRIGIWHITESSEELHAAVSLNSQEEGQYGTYKNENRKRQWLAYRAIVRHFIDKSLPANLCYDENGKPWLVEGPGFISVTHAGSYAAAVLSEKRAVGIDIEQLKERILRVKERFLCNRELDHIGSVNHLEKLYVLWGAKEALYKLNGKPNLDFKNEIYIHPFDYLCNMPGTCSATLTVDGCSNSFSVFYQQFGDYMLTVAY